MQMGSGVAGSEFISLRSSQADRIRVLDNSKTESSSKAFSLTCLRGYIPQELLQNCALPSNVSQTGCFGNCGLLGALDVALQR